MKNLLLSLIGEIQELQANGLCFAIGCLVTFSDENLMVGFDGFPTLVGFWQAPETPTRGGRLVRES